MGSSKEIFLDVAGFETEVKDFEKSSENVSKVSSKDIKNVSKKTILESMKVMESIINSFISCVDAYVKLSKKDVDETELIKDKWVQKDHQLANSIKGG